MEPYIGDLAIKSFTKSIVKLVLATQGMEGDEKGQAMLSNFVNVFYTKRKSRRDSRQLDIALYLQAFSQPFVDGELSEDKFRQTCELEVVTVTASTPFPNIFVKSLCDALYWEGRGSYFNMNNPLFDLPVITMAWTRARLQGGKKWYWYAHNLVAAFQSARTKYEETKQTIAHDHPGIDDPQEAQNLINQKLLELLLPTITDFVWKYNQNDIAAAVKGACWKLMHSLSKHKGCQAKAFMILGREFARQTKTKTTNHDGDDDGDNQVCQNKDGSDDDRVCQNESTLSSSSSSFLGGDEYICEDDQ